MADPPPREPTFNAANWVRQRRKFRRSNEPGEQGEVDTHGQGRSPGVGPERVSYLRGLSAKDLAAHIDIVLRNRIKGRETEYQSEDADRHRAKMNRQQHPLKRDGATNRGWREAKDETGPDRKRGGRCK